MGLILINLFFGISGFLLVNHQSLAHVEGEEPTNYTIELTAASPVAFDGDGFALANYRYVTLVYGPCENQAGYHVVFPSGTDSGSAIQNIYETPITGMTQMSVVFSGGSLTLSTGASFNNYYTSESISSGVAEVLTRSPSYFCLESDGSSTVRITSISITYSCVAPTDGVVYTLVDDHYEVTDYTGNPTSVTISETHNGLPVTAIANGAFYKSDMTSVTIPEGIATIGSFAFRQCRWLSSVHIPSTVTSIGTSAFLQDESLTHVTFAEDSALTTLGDGVFKSCMNLLDIYLPEGITAIPYQAFSADWAMTHIVVPASVVVIYENAFDLCDVIERVFFGGTPTQWGNIGFFTGNDFLRNAPISYFSETAQTGYWHYVSGVPTFW